MFPAHASILGGGRCSRAGPRVAGALQRLPLAVISVPASCCYQLLAVISAGSSGLGARRARALGGPGKSAGREVAVAEPAHGLDGRPAAAVLAELAAQPHDGELDPVR